MLDRKINVLILGQGGREHALKWKIAKSPWCASILCAPGNAGTNDDDRLAVALDDFPAIWSIIETHCIDLVVVGPEAPLAQGIVDAFKERYGTSRRIFGPSKAAAKLEWSKAEGERIGKLCGIPRPKSAVARTPEGAMAIVHAWGLPIVVKDDGLAAGKGVRIARTSRAAMEHATAIIESGRKVVFQELLSGSEFSMHFLCDGVPAHTIQLLTAQDEKRRTWGGPMTGGMGAYAPVPFIRGDIEARVREEIVLPVMQEMYAQGMPVTGVLYAGLMQTAEGPKLLEFNMRFGDPETQVLMMLLESDLLPYLWAASILRGLESAPPLIWSHKKAVATVLVEKNYPGAGNHAFSIKGTKAYRHHSDNTVVFHAGTRWTENRVTAESGRVLTVASRDWCFADARMHNRRAISLIITDPADSLDSRSDIGEVAERMEWNEKYTMF